MILDMKSGSKKRKLCCITPSKPTNYIRMKIFRKITKEIFTKITTQIFMKISRQMLIKYS